MHKHRKKSHPVEWVQEREKRGIPSTPLQLANPVEWMQERDKRDIPTESQEMFSIENTIENS